MKNGSVYVFECEDEYVPEKKQTRKKYRKLIGKLDEEGNIVPTRKKSPARKKDGQEEPKQLAAIKRLERTIEKQNEEVQSLKDEIDVLKTSNKKLRAMIRRASSALAEETVEEN